MKVVQLESGGYIRVEGDFNVLSFTKRDREFFSAVCDLFQGFERTMPDVHSMNCEWVKNGASDNPFDENCAYCRHFCIGAVPVPTGEREK